MQHRTQLYLDDDQHRWLKREAKRSGSIAAVVRSLVDEARLDRQKPADDPLIAYLAEEPPGEGAERSSVETLDDDVYA